MLGMGQHKGKSAVVTSYCRFTWVWVGSGVLDVLGVLGVLIVIPLFVGKINALPVTCRLHRCQPGFVFIGFAKHNIKIIAL